MTIKEYSLAIIKDASLSAIVKQHKIAHRFYFDKNDSGRVSEWPMEHAWKACVRLSVPRVRIPPLPPSNSPMYLIHGAFYCLKFIAPNITTNINKMVLVYSGIKKAPIYEALSILYLL